MVPIASVGRFGSLRDNSDHGLWMGAWRGEAGDLWALGGV